MTSYKLDFDQVCEASRGRALEILSYIVQGYDWNRAMKRHHFCPVHTGKNGDAFRCLTNRGNFQDVPIMVCNSCHGMKPVKGIINCVKWAGDFTNEYEAAKAIAEYLRLDSDQKIEVPKKKVYIKPKPKRNEVAADTLKKAWSSALPISKPKAFRIIKMYLESRGLSVDPSPIMRLGYMQYSVKDYYCTKLSRWVYKCLGVYPVILTLLETTKDSVPMNLHRTYLNPKTFEKLDLSAEVDVKKFNAKKVMVPVFEGATAQCSMKLFKPVNGVIGMAEGIETCFAVFEATGLPMWSAANQYALRTSIFPNEVKVVLPFGDLDVPDVKGVQVGVDAVKDLTDLVRKEGKISEFYLPNYDLTGLDKGIDWLDVLNDRGPSAFPDISKWLARAA